jgi:diacylglycerol kinase family enzyme
VPDRALLIANDNARGITVYSRDVIAKALSAEFRVEVAETKAPGHAMELAREAVDRGVDLVVALGGDGTVNEAANGLVGSHVPLAILPGGGVNVFARAIGIPTHPVEAAGHLLERLHAPPVRLGVGKADDRHFLMSCGIGFDAAVVHRVEGRQGMKRFAGDAFYAWSALRLFFRGFGRRHPRVHLAWGPGLDERRDGVFLAIVQNASPFVYWGARELRLCPHASFDTGLDVFALDTMNTRTVLRVVQQAIGSRRHVRNRHVLVVHDLHGLDVEGDDPLPVQTDGEYLGERTRVRLEFVPDALSVYD